MADLVSTDNPYGRISNSDPELMALVLQEAMFPFVGANQEWRAPLTGSDNTPTIDWTFLEASTVNMLVADLIHLRSIVNLQFKITPSVFYHLGP